MLSSYFKINLNGVFVQTIFISCSMFNAVMDIVTLVVIALLVACYCSAYNEQNCSCCILNKTISFISLHMLNIILFNMFNRCVHTSYVFVNKDTCKMGFEI